MSRKLQENKYVALIMEKKEKKEEKKHTHTHQLLNENLEFTRVPRIHEGSLNPQGDRILESIERNRHNLNFLGGYNMLNGKRNPRTAMKTPKNSNPR